MLRSTPVVVDGDTLTLRIYHHASSTGTQSQDQDDEQAAAAAAALVPPVRVRVRVRLFVAQGAHDRGDSAVLEGSAVAVAHWREETEEEEVEVAWDDDAAVTIDRSGRRRSVALMALRGSLVRVEVTGSSGLTLFSFGFK